MNPPLPCKSADDCEPLLPIAEADDPMPLADFAPEVTEAGMGCPALRWTTDERGARMAVAFSAMGFAIREQETHYLMRLDAAADRRLLQLYDLIATLRWRQPYRQLGLLERQEVADD